MKRSFDYLYALEKVNKAISKLILRGSMSERLASAVNELASPGLANVPHGETRELCDWIFSTLGTTKASAMTEDEAEKVAEAIWELRARLETDNMLSNGAV